MTLQLLLHLLHWYVCFFLHLNQWKFTNIKLPQNHCMKNSSRMADALVVLGSKFAQVEDEDHPCIWFATQDAATGAFIPTCKLEEFLSLKIMQNGISRSSCSWPTVVFLPIGTMLVKYVVPQHDMFSKTVFSIARDLRVFRCDVSPTMRVYMQCKKLTKAHVASTKEDNDFTNYYSGLAIIDRSCSGIVLIIPSVALLANCIHRSSISPLNHYTQSLRTGLSKRVG